MHRLQQTEPVNNYMYCDTTGEFGYRLRGRVPIRRDADQDDAGTWVPVPGYISDHEWERLIPPNELPSVRNPQNGYAVTCNQKVTTDDYPYIISQHYGSDARARRITDRIEQVALGAMTVAEMGSIHKDRISISGQYVIKVVSTIDPPLEQRHDPAQLLLVGTAICNLSFTHRQHLPRRRSINKTVPRSSDSVSAKLFLVVVVVGQRTGPTQDCPVQGSRRTSW